jgi:cell division protein FtsZ
MLKFATIDKQEPLSAKLKVVGVGGGGCNAIKSMMKRGLSGVQYVAINTDAQVLRNSGADFNIQVGTNLTKGLGAGADPKIGRKAIEEDRDIIEEVLAGCDMVFVTAGMGGGTGTGGIPIVASIAKSLGALVIGIVTKPFGWEGKKRMFNAEEGIRELKQYVDSLIVIPNGRLINILDKSVSAATAFDKPNEVLFEATRGIADIITVPGVINVDFADVRSVMQESGDALMGCGIASGENRAVEAAQKAISSPLLEGMNIKGAKQILLNVTGSSNLTIDEITAGNEIIYEQAGEEANVIFGWVNKEEMKEYVSYTVIATGFNSNGNSMGLPNKAEEVPPNNNFGGFGGFNPKQYSFTETEDLNVPTINRVGGTKAIFGDNKRNPSNGFKLEKLDSFDKKKEEEKDKNKNQDDSSSFLRMMMD